jgi:hypothetical protein
MRSTGNGRHPCQCHNRQNEDDPYYAEEYRDFHRPVADTRLPQTLTLIEDGAI